MARNERFAAARAARHLTAGQLAELVADFVEQDEGHRPPIDADHIGRIERGLIGWPHARYRKALRAVLGCRADADLGLYHRRSATPAPEPSSPVAPGGDPLLAQAGAAAFGALTGDEVDALSRVLNAPPPAARLGMPDVQDLHYMIDDMEHVDHHSGGRTIVRSMALQQLATATQAAGKASFRSAEVREAWMSAVARLGRLAGFMSVDAREHEVARQCFVLSLNVAAQVDDWPSRLLVLSGMCRQAVHLGDGATALKLAQLARAGEPQASPTSVVVMRVLEARAYGLLGREADAVRAVHEAEDLFSSRPPADEPPWLWFYDEAQLAGDTGQALYPLAIQGHAVDAEARLRRAVDTHRPTDTRGRTFSLVKLATVQATREPGEEAYRTAREAVAAVRDLRSGRAYDYLDDLRRALRKAGTDEGRLIADDISATLKKARQG